MKKIFKNLFRNTISTVLTVSLSLIMLVTAVYAATTIGSNITTGGTLSVTGATSLSTASTTDDFWLGNQTTDDDDYLYMDASSTEYLMWDDNPGQFQVSDDLVINGNSTTTGNAIIGVSSWAAPTSTLTVVGNAYVNNKATTSHAFWAGTGGTVNYLDLDGGDIYAQNDVEIDGNLYLAGRATSTSATTTNYLYVGPDITEDANINFTGGDLVVADALNVGGVTYLDGALQATTTSLFTGAATFYSTVNISGLTTLGAATSTSATTTAYLYVGPDITEDTNINFTGGDLVVADALNVGGVAYLDGALQATSTSLFTGAATFYSTVNVSGLTTLDAATSTSATTTRYLYVGPDGTEPPTFDFNNGDLFVANDTYIGGNATTSGKTVFGATAPANNATTTFTFGSYSTANTKGLCLKFFSGGNTIYCFLNSTPALSCSANSCE
jgi:hypothetical protein